MEENTTNPNTSEGGGNTVMFVIGALILAGILGYVIFTSNENTNPSTAPTSTAPTTAESTVDETTPESSDSMMMMDDSISPEEQVQGMPATDQLKLQVDNSATTGTELNTSTTNPDAKVFNIEAGYPYYKPNLITVKKGDTVRIVMHSVDMMHDLNIDELGVKLPITKSGETNTVEFKVDKAGSYQFYCSVGQHRAAGQIGTLVVQE